jgi:hypothetical protein
MATSGELNAILAFFLDEETLNLNIAVIRGLVISVPRSSKSHDFLQDIYG